MDVVVAELLHSNKPVAVVDNIDEPQLSVTLIAGAEGFVFGAALPDPAALVHVFTVCVTVYVPEAVTVIDVVVAELLQSNEPVALVDNNDVPLQLSTTVTEGAGGIEIGAAVPEPAGLTHP